MPETQPSALPHGLRAIPPAVWGLAAACALPELVLLGADWGLWGSARWRPLAYAQGAFWAGLLHGWWPNYPAQPALMFLTYAWLHAGALHLLGNLGALLWLGPDLARQLGARRFLALWGAGMLGGAAAFGLLATTPAPMVGASGALFGLAAAAAAQAARHWRHGLALMAGLAALNLAAWLAAGGQLAWETHLGGMVAGGAAMAVWRRGQRAVQTRRQGR
jgi:membrane associated rhomboid family serine protease